MTRVLMTTDAVGGVWTYTVELVAALRAHAVDVTLAILGPPAREHQLRELARAGIADVVHLPQALEWMDDPWDDVDAAGDHLLRLAGRIDADVVHLGGFVHAALPWDRPVVVVAHSDVMSWWHHVRGGEVPAHLRTYRDRVRTGLVAATAVVALTEAGRADLVREYGVGATHVIHDGRTGSWVRARPKEPIVLGAGRLWDDAKDLRTLALAAEDLDWPVLVAGELPPDGVADAAQEQNGQRGGARLLGPLAFDELSTWLTRAAVFASPARYEPFGLGALEAALSGCALVLGDIATARELWDGCAVFVAPGDVHALHEALQGLCREPVRCTELGERARQRAAELSAARMAAAYADLYAALRTDRGASASGNRATTRGRRVAGVQR